MQTSSALQGRRDSEIEATPGINPFTPNSDWSARGVCAVILADVGRRGEFPKLKSQAVVTQ
jgi:hypothetical protein